MLGRLPRPRPALRCRFARSSIKHFRVDHGLVAVRERSKYGNRPMIDESG
jgi:hypothetical protein